MQSRRAINHAQSESYAEIAVNHWLLENGGTAIEYRPVLAELAQALVRNHNDTWLSDFGLAPPDTLANQLLFSAITANYQGDSDRAVQDALLARARFQEHKNMAGVSRSQAEYIYALRRQSKAKDCIRELTLLEQLLRNRKYQALEINAAYEHSVCENMRSNFAAAAQLAHVAVAQADVARYPSLGLRVLGLASSLNTSQGRTSQSWQIDQDGLYQFWEADYPAERAFQLYSDLQEATSRSEQWYLATLLQHEAIAMLEETGRADFKAIAYFQLGLLYLKSSDDKQARVAMDRANSLFSTLRQNQSTRFYQAYVAIELSRLEAVEGRALQAERRLIEIGPIVHQENNFIVLVPYYQALAEVEHQLNRPAREAANLRLAIELSERGLRTLHTEQERWQQYRDIDGAYHRLVELQLQTSQSNMATLQTWESYRALQIDPAAFLPERKVHKGPQVDVYVNSLKHSTLISFALFPHWINVWIADDRGIQKRTIEISGKDLEREVKDFLALCSNQNSDIKKVNSVGLRLYQLLLAPLDHFLVPGRTLLIEGDGILNRIPWSALSISRQAYLGDRFTVVNSPGLLYGSGSPAMPLDVNNALVVYPGAVTVNGHSYAPLPNADDELDYITRLLPGATRLEEKDATVSRFLSKIPKTSIIILRGMLKLDLSEVSCCYATAFFLPPHYRTIP